MTAHAHQIRAGNLKSVENLNTIENEWSTLLSTDDYLPFLALLPRNLLHEMNVARNPDSTLLSYPIKGDGRLRQALFLFLESEPANFLFCFRRFKGTECAE